MIAGRYSLDREIGRGGAGVVWLGRDEVLGRPVALKRIGRLQGGDANDLARAEREARLSARLNHPNVVSVFDFVVDDASDERWLVMEYVDGATLAQTVTKRRPLTPEQAAPILRQTADALAAAHRAGIVHRDVKPSNILLDRDRVVKLTDFGIARTAADPSLTQTGLLTGSPSYLAPEVVEGSRGDRRSDVWSLGATAYFALTGRAPYDGGDNVIGILYRIVNDEPPRLPEAGWAAELIAATMVTDPRKRWSADQVRDFVARHADAPPTRRSVTSTGLLPVRRTLPKPDATRVLAPAASPSRPRRPRSTVRPSARTLGLAALAGIVLVSAVLFSVFADGDGNGARGAGPSSSSPPAQPSSSAKPTAAGMEAFIRSYVATVSADPDRSWRMLTPKFQAQSGGLATYRRFWGRATDGRVLSISADPQTLVVRYQVHFDHFHNGPGPTVLGLVFQGGRYLIDGEYTKGFHPDS